MLQRAEEVLEELVAEGVIEWFDPADESEEIGNE